MTTRGSGSPSAGPTGPGSVSGSGSIAGPATPSASASAPRSAKRQKIFRACATCVTSKTRCEDVSAEGCSLCRRRGRPCSLAAIASALEGGSSVNGVNGVRAAPTPNGHGPDAYGRAEWAPTPTPTPITLEEMQRRLTDAERRVAHTETVVLDLEAQLLGERRERAARGYSATRTMSRSRSRSPPHTSRTPPSIEPQVGPLRFTSMLLYRLDESMLTLASTRLYPDPVARGVVSAAHVELAWHGFKARIAALLPLPPFLAVSTPVPAHGFVVAAALTHVQSAYTPDLEPLLDECILLAMGSAVSIDVMLALLIFSLAPLPPDHEDGRAGLDPPREHSTAAAGTRRRHRLTARGPYRLISLAFQMGQSFGFEAMAESALKRGQELNDEWNGEQLWHLQLWAAIVNRFCLLALINGQIMSLPARVADRLPLLQRDAVEMCNRHLRAEASAIAIFEPVARKLSALEHTNNYDLESLREFQTVWSRAKEQSNALLQGDTQPPSVQRDLVSIQFAFGVRIASLTTWIPSPLREARELALPNLATFPSVMTQMMDMVAAEGTEPWTFPSYTIMLACAALICFRRAVKFVRLVYRSTSLVDAGRLDAAEDRLMGLSRSTRFFITEANRLLTQLPYSEEWLVANAHAATAATTTADGATCPVQVSLNSAPGFIPLDFDIFSWDFSFLYPDLASFENIIETTTM